MTNSPTIVSASLDDKEMRQSIANLVAYVKRATHTMTGDLDSAVEKMNASLKKLGTPKSVGGSANTSATKQDTQAVDENTNARKKNAQAIKEQTQANKESSVTFDQMANAQKKAIESQHKLAFSRANKIPTDQYDLAQAKLERLQALLTDMRKLGILSPSQIASTEVEIRRLEQLLRNSANEQQQLTQNSQRYTEEIRKQLAAITSKKDATKAFEQISIMPSNTMDEIKAKGQALVELVKKVKDTPLMSQSNVKLAEKMIGSLANQYRALKEEKEKVANTQTINAAAENTTRRSLEQEKQDLERLKALQEERRQQIIQTGIAAQQQARILRESIGQQMQSADYTKQVDKVKELQNALTEMKNAYKQPIDSSIKKSLEEDIAITQKALDIAKRYNMTVAGLGAVGVGGKAPTDTLAAYSAEAQRLAGIYKNLSTEERSASAGQGLKRKYQELSRTASQVRKELERPINLKDAMKGGESTIDDLAYKIQRLQSYKRGLDFKTQAGEIQEVDNKIKSLNAELNKYLATAKNVQSQNTALGRSWNYMKNRLAFYFTVGASTSFVKNLIEIRSQYEMNERALGILIDSAERGTRIFNELSQMALVSPYTLIELSTAAKQLTAYDIAAKDVVDTTRRLADMAAAVGIPIERLTYALGQIKAYGYLNARDARMFSNAGIPLVKQLADYYTELEGKMVSTADVYDRIKKKAIGMSDVVQVINKMTDEGGKFFDFQAKMADTLKVRLANLTLAWNNMLNEIGKEQQGVLTWGIGALRDLFLQWKNINSMMTEAAVAFGAYKAIQLLILALQAATGKTLGLNKTLTLTGVLGTKLAGVVRNLGGAFSALASNWWMIAIAAAVELVGAINNANEATKEFNKSIRDGAATTAEDLKKYTEQYKELRESLYKKEITNNGKGYRVVPQDINVKDANKAWESMKEQIELSSAASDAFIARLLQIKNVSERLREGFKIIDDILAVDNALKEMGDNALVVTQKWSAWWNAWQAPDGLFTNLKDFKSELDEIRNKYGDIANARYVAEHGDTNQAADKQNSIMRDATDAINAYDRELKRFKEDLDKYTVSLDNFANAMGFSANPTQIAELYAKASKQLATHGQLSPQEAFELQVQVEEARMNAMKLALQSRIADESKTLEIEQDERKKKAIEASIETNKAQLELFSKSTAEESAYWNDFTKYIKERHISELSAAYNAMTDNGKKTMDFQSQEWQDYVHKWANSYEKSHNLAYDSVFNRLKNWIKDANTWDIFIKMTISTDDKKSVYKELGEFDKAADDAYKTMQRLDKEIRRLRKKGVKEITLGDNLLDESKLSADEKKLKNAIEERAQAQNDYNEAVANGGESKKENADGSKAQKQAESELQKALKEELQLIDKVRSSYKTLTKEGVGHVEAIEQATSGFSESVSNINKVIGKYGIGQLDLTKYAGVTNPTEIVNMLESQVNKLLKSGVAKPAEIQDLQVKIRDLKVDAASFNAKTVTDSLNNALGKLKDEYELAVELDANPELGDMFLDMFGIDKSALSSSMSNYMSAVQAEFDKARQKMGYESPLNVFKADSDEWVEWGRKVGIVKDTLDEQGNVIASDTEALDKFKSKFVEAQGVAKKWAQDTVKQTLDLQYKLSDTDGKIAIELKKLNRLQEQFVNATDPQQIELLSLQIQEEEHAIAKLKEEIMQTLPLYKALFAGEFEMSANKTNRLAKQYRDALLLAKSGGLFGGNYTYTDPISGKKAPINKNQMEKELKNANKLIKQTSSPFKQISDAFKKGSDGTTDWAKGVELLGGELSKVGGIVSSIGDFAEQLGFSRETVEIINDVATSLNGVATMAQGVGQIASGDYIGGAASMLSGLMTTIGAWLDNGDNKILDQIKESERAVKSLENTYRNLSHTAENAYGAMISGAKKAMQANKELQLIELQRQLTLERSRSSKKRDEDKIIELEGQIIDLKNEIHDASQDIINDLLGISSAGDGITTLVSAMIEAFRNGEDAMEAFGDSWDEMIDNMMLKLIVSQYMSKAWNELMEKMQKKQDEMLKTSSDAQASAQQEVDRLSEMTDAQLAMWMFENGMLSGLGSHEDSYDDFKAWLAGANGWSIVKPQLDAYRKAAEAALTAATETLEGESFDYTKWSLDYMNTEGRDYMMQYAEMLKNALSDWYTYGENAEGNLSALQQGIQSVSETTASALEAYMNGVSQQVYLHSQLLTEIRDAVLSISGGDIQLGVQSQMLLQLQDSYTVQKSIESILAGVLNPSGRAFAVELIS